MVIPRSRSRSMSSRSCSRNSRWVIAPDWSRSWSASVLLPWSMWATIEKLRMYLGSKGIERSRGRGGVSRRADDRPDPDAGTGAGWLAFDGGCAARARRPARRGPQGEVRDDVGIIETRMKDRDLTP